MCFVLNLKQLFCQSVLSDFYGGRLQCLNLSLLLSPSCHDISSEPLTHLIFPDLPPTAANLTNLPDLLLLCTSLWNNLILICVQNKAVLFPSILTFSSGMNHLKSAVLYMNQFVHPLNLVSGLETHPPTH